jgi:glucokinase
VARVADEVVLDTSDHASLADAWKAYGARIGRELPRAVGIAAAGPVGGAELRLTNNRWVIRPDEIPKTLDVDRFKLVNDFGAVAYAVSALESACFRHLCGPDEPLPDTGVISVVGPGTGLGVAVLVRGRGGARVIEAEGAHGDFSPTNPLEDLILTRLRAVHGRVSIERVVSGPGLVEIHSALAADRGQSVQSVESADLWDQALRGEDALAVAALERFFQCLGTATGNIALTQGAQAVVIGGGLGQRLADRLPSSGFEARFRGKGRMEDRMAAMPVKVITYPEPGLYGAAVAFAEANG